MIKVYVSENDILLMNKWHSTPFLMEPESFQFTDDIDEADMFALLPDADLCYAQYNTLKDKCQGKLILVLFIYHITEGHTINDVKNVYEKVFHNYRDNLIYVHTDRDNPTGVYYDFLWNRQKACFQDFDTFNLNNTVYLGDVDSSMFELPEFKKTKNPKIFLAPNRIHGDPSNLSDRQFRRIVLKHYLQGKNGYLSDPENGVIFKPNGLIRTDGIGFEGFNPVHNKYYTDSFISIYVETLTHFNNHHHKVLHSITEKTWNPLIKGHYILPYGYCGMVKHIREYGFVFPDWINYHYDGIEDDNDRFLAYIIEVNRLTSLPIEFYQEQFERDKSLLEYNRNLFFDNGYDKLYQKIMEYLNRDNENQ